MTTTIDIPRELVDRCPPTPFPFDDTPTDVIYPPRELPDEPLPPPDDIFYSARYILEREEHEFEPGEIPAHIPGAGRTSPTALGALVATSLVARWVWIALAAVLVPLALATTAVLAARADAAPVPHIPPEAPVTAVTPTPSPLGLSVVDDSPAAFVAGVLGVRGGGVADG